MVTKPALGRDDVRKELGEKVARRLEAVAEGMARRKYNSSGHRVGESLHYPPRSLRIGELPLGLKKRRVDRTC
jgi:hypothetical protein